MGWHIPRGRHQTFECNLGPEAVVQMPERFSNASPIDFFREFVNDELIALFVNETNRYAEQEVRKRANEADTPFSRIRSWTATDQKEMLKFLGLIGYMGLVKMPHIADYWSRQRLYKNEVAGNVMSRNRFELLLSMWHFSNNEECPSGDRIFKLSPLMKMLELKYKELLLPGKTICIDESLIPFRGRLIMKQYIPSKAHKYGVKAFKLCCSRGYTWKILLYAGQEKVEGMSVPTNVVLSLANDLLGAGRIIVTDNYYTSLELANFLLERQTHLIGTLRRNRKHIPKDVASKKLKKGEIIARENEKGITVLKWKDKRDVLMLSTVHGDETIEIQRRRETIKKPVMIVEYNAGKGHTDLSDQMSSYVSSLRKTVKWYRKIAIKLIYGTTLVNAHILYKMVTGKTIQYTEFKESVVLALLEDHTETETQEDNYQPAPKRQAVHTLERKQGDNRKVRRYCKGCYDKKMKGIISKNIVKKVVTYCPMCIQQPHYCLPCFSEAHK